MDDLLGCPWCGTGPLLLETPHGGYFYVSCENADCSVRPDTAVNLQDTMEQAISAWNVRVKPVGGK